MFSIVIPLLFGATECASITRETLAPCVAAGSLDLAARALVAREADARVAAASPLLPSNPVVSFSAAQRQAGTATAVNLYGTLSVELEIAGQRGKRIEAAEHARDAEKQRTEMLRRAVLARAWRAYFVALAAEERAALAVRLDKNASDVAAIAKAQAEKGVLSPVAAQVASASAVQIARLKIAIEKERRLALAELEALVGASVVVSGALAPLPVPLSAEVLPQVTAAAADLRALEAKASQLRRERAPNPTLSFIAQSDGFNERVLGAGLAFPIPLPWPLGRTNKGEIAEVEAATARVEIERQRLERQLARERIEARATYDASRDAATRFTPGDVKAAETSLDNLRDAIASGRMAVDAAITMRQTLIEYLQGHVETKLAHALASVDLVLTSGGALDGGAP